MSCVQIRIVEIRSSVELFFHFPEGCLSDVPIFRLPLGEDETKSLAGAGIVLTRTHGPEKQIRRHKLFAGKLVISLGHIREARHEGHADDDLLRLLSGSGVTLGVGTVIVKGGLDVLLNSSARSHILVGVCRVLAQRKHANASQAMTEKQTRDRLETKQIDHVASGLRLGDKTLLFAMLDDTPNNADSHFKRRGKKILAHRLALGETNGREQSSNLGSVNVQRHRSEWESEYGMTV